VSSLLSVISDPKAAQDRLDQINKAQSDLNQKVATAQQSEEAAKAAQAAADKSLKEQQELKKYNEEVLSIQQSDLTARIDSYDTALKEHQDRVSKELKDINQQRQNNADKEVELSQRESAVSAREDAVSVREQEAESAKEEYTTRLSKLKNILN
jgi:DNA repair exonuclease SbcCD ATPase subunit